MKNFSSNGIRLSADYNETKNWTHEKEERSDNGISTDLKSIILEDNYRILFYSDVRNNDDELIMDFIPWITIPEPQVFFTTIPDSFGIRLGQQTQINLRIDSLNGYQPL